MTGFVLCNLPLKALPSPSNHKMSVSDFHSYNVKIIKCFTKDRTGCPRGQSILTELTRVGGKKRETPNQHSLKMACIYSSVSETQNNLFSHFFLDLILKIAKDPEQVLSDQELRNEVSKCT